MHCCAMINWLFQSQQNGLLRWEDELVLAVFTDTVYTIRIDDTDPNYSELLLHVGYQTV